MVPRLTQLLVVYLGGFSGLPGTFAADVSVPTSSGPVEGHLAANTTRVLEFLGIPYAAPPVANLRFQPPAPYKGKEVINGTDFGFICMQVDMFAGAPTQKGKLEGRALPLTPAGYALLQEYFTGIPPISEDCLTLNVWAKGDTGGDKKAVMVWIHGGGFTSGSSAVPFYTGKYLAEQDDVIVVSLNYRLNIFGFPGAESFPSNNLGLLDQRLAIEWVRDNIANFGGDPDRIILFGQSAGGSSVGYQSYGWASDPVVQGYILESAVSLDANSKEQAQELWANATRLANCSDGSSDSEAADSCMRLDVSATDLLAISRQLYFGPTVDGRVVFDDYETRRPADKPVIVGHNDYEPGLTKVLAPPLPEIIWQQQELAFGCAAAERAAYFALNGLPTWRYRWFGDWTNLRLTENPTSGAWHGSEILPIFNTIPQTVAVNTPEETSIANYIRGAWVAFAKDSVNGLRTYGSGWPQYSTNGDTLVRLAFNNVTGTNLVAGNTYDIECPPYPVVPSL
ncbi:uncharacterized protein JN550_006954 [Neoarthrinium moseri]|uniref:uncharacterized protein n=1 Tax=Neoarthrinium moseri TaxID=1658444 RepID=UPI001FDB3D38|nr:uncharacterized protein JN550_006954 [Neoarthrinium moseri]KAI1867813.1 hypothetical protein JN550_006954 [Neoarthrinium moseri]